MRGGELKHVMKQALEGVLPETILHREKRGFGAPMGAWFRAELAALVRDVLSKEVVERRGLLDPDAVQRTIREHEQQQADRTDHLLGADQSRALVPAVSRRGERRRRRRMSCAASLAA